MVAVEMREREREKEREKERRGGRELENVMRVCCL